MLVLNDPVNFWEGSLLLIDKPKTWTSFDVVNKVRYALKIPGKKIKVGHAGTLDPLATGLLLLCIGKFTKEIDSLQGMDKVYRGIIRIGATTPSYDEETEINATFPIENITEEKIQACVHTFIGKQEQMPPIHSAIKIDGKRAYKMARQGHDIAMKMRSIEIFDFQVEQINLPDISFSIHCSKGTYIRSIAYDLGRKLDNGGYLASLQRTAIGPYLLENAWQLDELIQCILDRKKILDF